MKHENACPHKKIVSGCSFNTSTGSSIPAWICEWCDQLFYPVTVEQLNKIKAENEAI